MTQDRSAMERIRADLIRRARMERQGDTEQGIDIANQPEMQEQPQTRTMFPLRLFGRRRDPPARPQDTESQVSSPKSPDFNLITPDLPSSPLDMPNLARTWTDDPPHRPQPATPGVSAPVSPHPPSREMPSPPAPTAWPGTAASSFYGTASTSTTPAREPVFDGPDPAEVHLARLAEDGRRRGRRRRDGAGHSRRHRGRREHERQPPRKFLFCFPWVKSRRMRSRILRCFVSGMFLCSLIAVYFGLSLTKKIKKGELTIMLILIILLATVFFCYSLMQLCVLVVRGDRERARRGHAAQHLGTGGYVVPPRPIRVVMARDEEEAGAEAEAAKCTPPAYGLWRESVRVDPDRLFWQRNEAAAAGDAEGMPRRPETSAGPRPPSYASDDGVSYVVEAAPRSTAPREDASQPLPLPLHPSEVGRVAHPPW